MAKAKKITFVKGTMATVVWDPNTNRSLVEFEDGLFTTSDPKVINKLKDLGYKTKEDYPHGPPVDGFEHQKTTLAPPKPLDKSIPSTLVNTGSDEQEPVSPDRKPDKKVRVKNQKTRSTSQRKPIKRRGSKTS